MNGPAQTKRSHRVWEWLALASLAVGLATFFWWPLPVRGGLIGGDTYNYFFPLRDFYRQGLLAGELRLWHPGIGNGVPILGESQTGLFYPFYLLAYRLLDLNDAYSAIFLGHYLFAYLATYALARFLGGGPLAAHAGAIIFVYGWFPPRACLEWAIVTGAWLPVVIGRTLAFLARGGFARWSALAIAVACQLLAGHFNLAWITNLTAAILILLPLGWILPQAGPMPMVRRANALLALIIGFALAGPQLLPAWELKQVSQRSADDFLAEISKGNVPPAYFVRSQWPLDYLHHRDEVLAELQALTNQVEAHLYLGPTAIALAGLALILGWSRPQGVFWWLLALGMGMLATGIAMPALASLPGFSFFRYCGRYGIVTQLGMALAASAGLQALYRRAPRAGTIVSLISAGLLLAEYTFVGHQVQYVTMVDPPMINRRPESRVFGQLKPTNRVLAIDGNTLALSGAACVPPYLGMGPAEYYKTWERFPNVFTGQTPFEPTLGETLDRMGVSHLLTLAPLPTGWPTTLIWSGYDPFLHPRWGRDPHEPLYLYRYDPWRGRASRWVDDRVDAEGGIDATLITPHRVVVETHGPTPARIVLSDLPFPGWSVTVNGTPQRAVAGSTVARLCEVPAGKVRVEWTYRPDSLVWGLRVAGLAATIMIGLGMAAIRSSVSRPSPSPSSRGT